MASLTGTDGGDAICSRVRGVLDMVWISLLSGLALAQDTHEDPLEPVEPEELSVRFAEDHTWVDVTPTLAGDRAFVSVARDPFHSGNALATDIRGAVWLSVDGAVTWSLVLKGTRSAVGEAELDEEALLLEAEATAEDLFGDEFESDEEEFESEDEDEIQETLELVADANVVDQMMVDEDADSSTWVSAGSMSGLRLGGEVWYHPQEDDLVLLSRSDGTWRSTDGGRSFRQVGDLSTATDFEVAPWGVLLAGTPEGIRYSVNLGRTWIESSGEMSEARVRDLAYDPQSLTWYAATDRGLYSSPDAQTWTQLGEWSADLRAVLVDPYMDGGLWLATDTEVLRSDDGGLGLFPLARHPLPGTSNLTLVDRGQLLQSGSDGVWETHDGGVTWQPINVGLPGPIVHDVEVLGDKLVCVGPRGVFRLVDGVPGPPAEEVAQTAETVPALDTVLGMALSRPGMDPLADGRFAGKVTQRGIPQLLLRTQVSELEDFGADYSSRTNDGANDLTWRATVELRWGRSDSTTEIATIEDSYFVLGDQVYSSSDRTALPAAAANATSRSVQYRQHISGTVMELYFTRHELVQQRDVLPPADLRARAHHELKIQEVTAMLDVYTDSGFSASLQGGS